MFWLIEKYHFSLSKLTFQFTDSTGSTFDELTLTRTQFKRLKLSEDEADPDIDEFKRAAVALFKSATYPETKDVHPPLFMVPAKIGGKEEEQKEFAKPKAKFSIGTAPGTTLKREADFVREKREIKKSQFYLT